MSAANRLDAVVNRMYWLSYGGGVNSTALAVLLVDGKLPQFNPWRILFSDTGEEKPATYAYIRDHFAPWLEQRGKVLEVVRPKETVLERWERLKVTGSRLLRSCTDEGKVKPMERYRLEHGGGEMIVGIDAGEAHRMAGREGIHRPLVDLGIDRDGCVKIIEAAGLPVPDKSGCWCCPFMRVKEVVDLARYEPCKFERIVRLEAAANETHGPAPDGTPRTQWGNKPALYWRDREHHTSLSLFDAEPPDPHCECFDG